MAWMDPQWPERDEAYAEKLKAEGVPKAPNTPANRTSTRIGIACGAVSVVIVLAAVAVIVVR